MSLTGPMIPLLARVVAFEDPQNLIFLDYLMFNFQSYIEDPAGSKAIIMILKRTKYGKFVDHCIHFTEKIIEKPATSSHIANLMIHLLELDIEIGRFENLIRLTFKHAHLIFLKSKVLCKPFVKLATKLPDHHLLSLFEILKGDIIQFIPCKSRNYLVQEFVVRETLPSYVVSHI